MLVMFNYVYMFVLRIQICPLTFDCFALNPGFFKRCAQLLLHLLLFGCKRTFWWHIHSTFLKTQNSRGLIVIRGFVIVWESFRPSFFCANGSAAWEDKKCGNIKFRQEKSRSTDLQGQWNASCDYSNPFWNPGYWSSLNVFSINSLFVFVVFFSNWSGEACVYGSNVLISSYIGTFQN